jgi:hypothetical protein
MVVSEFLGWKIRQNGEQSVGVSKNEPFSEYAGGRHVLPSTERAGPFWGKQAQVLD